MSKIDIIIPFFDTYTYSVRIDVWQCVKRAIMLQYALVHHVNALHLFMNVNMRPRLTVDDEIIVITTMTLACQLNTISFRSPQAFAFAFRMCRREAIAIAFKMLSVFFFNSRVECHPHVTIILSNRANIFVTHAVFVVYSFLPNGKINADAHGSFECKR